MSPLCKHRINPLDRFSHISPNVELTFDAFNCTNADRPMMPGDSHDFRRESNHPGYGSFSNYVTSRNWIDL